MKSSICGPMSDDDEPEINVETDTEDYEDDNDDLEDVCNGIGTDSQTDTETDSTIPQHPRHRLHGPCYDSHVTTTAAAASENRLNVSTANKCSSTLAFSISRLLSAECKVNNNNNNNNINFHNNSGSNSKCGRNDLYSKSTITTDNNNRINGTFYTGNSSPSSTVSGASTSPLPGGAFNLSSKVSTATATTNQDSAMISTSPNGGGVIKVPAHRPSNNSNNGNPLMNSAAGPPLASPFPWLAIDRSFLWCAREDYL